MLKKIIVEGLFDSHDVEIDFDKKLNVMIGENGIGKTTIMKLLYTLSLNNLSDLTKYIFRRIRIIKENEEFAIVYTDLFPDTKFIIDNITIDSGLSENENLCSLLEWYKKKLSTLERKNRFQFCQYLSICFNNDEVTAKEKLNNIDLGNLVVEYFSFNSATEVRKSLKNTWYKETIFDYNRLRLYKIFDSELINLNMVIDYKYKNEVVSKGYYYSDMLGWLKSYYSFSYKRSNAKNHFEYVFKSRVFYENDYSSIGLNHIQSRFKDEYIVLLKKAYENIRLTPRYLDDEFALVKNDLIIGGELDINRIINRYYYDLDFIMQVNTKAIESYIDLIGSESDYIFIHDSQVSKFLSKGTLNDIKCFLKPLIIEDTLFYDLIESIESRGYEQVQIHEKLFHRFVGFYEENIDKIKKKKSNQIMLLEELLKEFIKNKSVYLTPSGIIFHPKHLVKRRGNLKLIVNDKSIIPISELSSGERKILTILVIAIFYKDSILLIDEPELSLSLVWQEKLLPLLIDKTDINKIIVATHSPYLISNKLIEDAIIPLPMEENDAFE